MKRISYILLAISLVVAKGIVAYPVKFKNATKEVVTVEIVLAGCPTTIFTLYPDEVKSIDTGICCTQNINVKIEGDLVSTITPPSTGAGMRCSGYAYTFIIDEKVRQSILELHPDWEKVFGKRFSQFGFSIVEGIR